MTDTDTSYTSGSIIGRYALKDSDRQALLDELKSISEDNHTGYQDRQIQADDIRFCRWTGQADDGLKHQVNMPDKKEPFPYEGAPDNRVRLADGIIQEKVDLYMAAARRMAVSVRGTEAIDETAAARMRSLIHWMLSTQVSNWYDTLERCANHQLGSDPALAVAGVFWKLENGIEPIEVDLETLLNAIAPIYAEVSGLTEFDELVIAEQTLLSIQDPEQTPLIIDLMAEVFPGVEEKNLRTVLRGLQSNPPGHIEIMAQEYPRVGRPCVKALRINHDVFLPFDTQDPQDARVIFVREWIGKAELQSRQRTMGYRPAFIRKLIGTDREGGCEGQSALTLHDNDVDTYIRDFGDNVGAAADVDAHDADYEIIAAYFKRTDSDGRCGVYYVHLSGVAEAAATEVRLLDYAHGRYPFAFSPRERLTNRLLDSRSVSIVAMTDQATVKRHTDAFDANAQLSTLPPINDFSFERRKLIISPLAQNFRDRQEDWQFAAIPPYPKTAADFLDRTDRRVCRYWGLPHPEVPPEVTIARQQREVDNWLTFVRDILVQVMQLTQQYIDDETLQRVTGPRGLQMPRSRAEIQGQYDITIAWDVREADRTHVVEVAKTISEMIAPMDTEATIIRPRLVSWLLNSMFPALAEEVLDSPEGASMREMEDEQRNFAVIMSGQEPPMKEQGQNFALRLQVLQGLAQTNPDAFNRAMSTPDIAARLENRIKHLQFQVQQQQNAATGRVGTEPIEAQ